MITAKKSDPFSKYATPFMEIGRILHPGRNRTLNNTAMPETFSLSIPKPCHEQWESFTKTDTGGFCASCQKNVIDFTNWNDEQIRQYINAANQRICGRFNPSQLKTYRNTATTPRPSHMFISALALPLLLSAVDTKAQTSTSHTAQYIQPEKTTDKSNTDTQNNQQASANTIWARGIVRTKEDSALVTGAFVTWKGTTTQVITDANGHFSIKLADAQGQATLIVSFIGTITQEITITQDREIDIYLESDLRPFSGELIITRASLPRRIWWKIKNIF